MALLIVGLLIFLGIHSSSIIARSWRDQMVSQLGLNKWKAVYSVVALLGFILIIYGYGMARQEQFFLYHPPTWLRHMSSLFMLVALPALVASQMPAGYIKRALKHPMLVATHAWAVAHLLANGGSADIVLFGSFLVWSVVDRISVKRRPDQPTISSVSVKYDVIAVIIGLALYVLLIAVAHKWLFGVSPMGM